MTCFTFDVPIKAQSTSNLREHWAARHKRTDAQKAATRRKCPEWTAGPLLYVRLTRVAPRPLDDDNLRGALKSVRDAIATWLRVDDRTPLVGWLYAQAKGSEALVRVEVGWADSPLANAARTAQALDVLARFRQEPAGASQDASPLPDQGPAAFHAMAAPPGPPESIFKASSRRARKSPAEVRALATPATYPAAKEKKP